MKRVFRALLAITLLLSFGTGAVAYGAPPGSSRVNTQVEEVKQRYFRLRNTDPRVQQREEWERVGAELEAFAAQHRDHSAAPSALLHAAIVHEQLYRHANGGDTALRTALALLELLSTRYANSTLADDALVRRGDLLAPVAPEEARRLYEKVVARYPRSDQAQVARARLSQLQSPRATAPRVREARKSAGRRIVVVIDPGHGGEDHGAVGQGGLLEKDVVLDIAFALEKLLVEELGADVRLTRRGDEFVPLAERTEIANDFDAQLFISLHTNASPTNKLHGLEAYYLDNTGDEASKKLAERENASLQLEGGGIGDLEFMLSDLIQSSKLDDSIRLAHDLNDALLAHLQGRWQGVRSYGVKRAPFYVLVGAHMPCVLMELFFIDHPQDGVRLADKRFRHEIARGLLAGIRTFVERGHLPSRDS